MGIMSQETKLCPECNKKGSPCESYDGGRAFTLIISSSGDIVNDGWNYYCSHCGHSFLVTRKFG